MKGSSLHELHHLEEQTFISFSPVSHIHSWLTCCDLVVWERDTYHEFVMGWQGGFSFSPTSLFPCVGTSVQSLSHVWLFAIPWITACQASLSITNSQSSLRLTYLLILVIYFATVPQCPPHWQPLVLFSVLWVCFCFVIYLFYLRFHIYKKTYTIYLS